MDHLENFDGLEGLTDLEGLADLRLDDLISDEFSFDDLEGFGDPEEPEKWETPETEDTSEEEEPPETEDTSEEEEPLETEDTPEEEETPEVPEARGKRGRPKVEKQDRAIITMLSVVLALLVALIVVVAVLKFYVLVNWRLYPKNALELDLREKTLSVTEYDAIQEKLPNCRLRWFAVAGAALGMFMYKKTLSPLIILTVTKVFSFLLNLAGKIFRMIMKPFQFVGGETLKGGRFVKKKAGNIRKLLQKKLTEFMKTLKIILHKQ